MEVGGRRRARDLPLAAARPVEPVQELPDLARRRRPRRPRAAAAARPSTTGSWTARARRRSAGPRAAARRPRAACRCSSARRARGARAAGSSARPRRGEPPPRLVQVLGHDLHVGEHRHEVRVAGPARDDVLVHVVDDPGARDAAEVPAEVEALRVVDGARAPRARRPRARGSRPPRPARAPRTRRRAGPGRSSGGPTSTGSGSGARTRARPGGRRAAPRRRPPRRCRRRSRPARPPPGRTRAATAPTAASSRRVSLCEWMVEDVRVGAQDRGRCARLSCSPRSPRRWPPSRRRSRPSRSSCVDEEGDNGDAPDVVRVEVDAGARRSRVRRALRGGADARTRRGARLDHPRRRPGRDHRPRGDRARSPCRRRRCQARGVGGRALAGGRRRPRARLVRRRGAHRHAGTCRAPRFACVRLHRRRVRGRPRLRGDERPRAGDRACVLRAARHRAGDRERRARPRRRGEPWPPSASS